MLQIIHHALSFLLSGYPYEQKLTKEDEYLRGFHVVSKK